MKNGKEKMVYLFVGQDIPAKDAALKRIKEKFLPPKLIDFNFDILYTDELSLEALQEKLLFLPVGAPKRVVLIRNAQDLEEEQKDFILRWALKENKNLLLILDFPQQKENAKFINALNNNAQVMRFKEDIPLNAFNLSRQIEYRYTEGALKILKNLIKEGQKPEMILGALRYSLQSNTLSPLLLRRRIKLLLNCDIEIKTGRFKPVFALEKLVVNLCALV